SSCVSLRLPTPPPFPYTTLFRSLITGGERRGVHVLLVPIRDERGRPCRNVRIEDCGHKGGLNGVDNGRLWFDQVRVPREALLDRDRKSTRLNSSHSQISYAVFCL